MAFDDDAGQADGAAKDCEAMPCSFRYASSFAIAASSGCRSIMPEKLSVVAIEVAKIA
jgi:hypothetical protein